MKYPNHPGHKGLIETGRASAEALASSLGKRQRETLEALEEIGPATADEVADHIERHWYVTRPRFSELRELGLIVDTGQRKETGMGGKTWVARIATPDELACHLATKAVEAEKSQ